MKYIFVCFMTAFFHFYYSVREQVNLISRLHILTMITIRTDHCSTPWKVV